MHDSVPEGISSPRKAVLGNYHSLAATLFTTGNEDAEDQFLQAVKVS